MQITGSPVHEHGGPFRQRPRHLPGLPGRDPRPCGHAARGERLPGATSRRSDVFTPGDTVDVLVAMNPAALKTNVADLKTNGILIVNTDDFKETDLKKAQCQDQSARGPLARRLPPVQGRAHQADPRSPCATSASTPRAWTAARTSSRSACATGSTTGSMDPHAQVARRRSSRPSPSSPRPTSWP